MLFRFWLISIFSFFVHVPLFFYVPFPVKSVVEHFMLLARLRVVYSEFFHSMSLDISIVSDGIRALLQGVVSYSSV